jgi:hypothetical protein
MLVLIMALLDRANSRMVMPTVRLQRMLVNGLAPDLHANENRGARNRFRQWSGSGASLACQSYLCYLCHPQRHCAG